MNISSPWLAVTVFALTISTFASQTRADELEAYFDAAHELAESTEAAGQFLICEATENAPSRWSENLAIHAHALLNSSARLRASIHACDVALCEVDVCCIKEQLEVIEDCVDHAPERVRRKPLRKLKSALRRVDRKLARLNKCRAGHQPLRQLAQRFKDRFDRPEYVHTTNVNTIPAQPEFIDAPAFAPNVQPAPSIIEPSTTPQVIEPLPGEIIAPTGFEEELPMKGPKSILDSSNGSVGLPIFKSAERSSLESPAQVDKVLESILEKP